MTFHTALGYERDAGEWKDFTVIVPHGDDASRMMGLTGGASMSDGCFEKAAASICSEPTPMLMIPQRGRCESISIA